LLSAKDEPMLFPKHLPAHIRIQVARGSFPMSPDAAVVSALSVADPGRQLQWKDMRKAAVSAAEIQYVKSLMASVGGDIDNACRISGLSRSRFYSLLRKNRIANRY
jgi:two-component system NtrC family response regulator